VTDPSPARFSRRLLTACALSALAAWPAAAESALVFGPRNSIGLACKQPDRASAIAAATQECQKNSSRCRLVLTFHDQCIAIARPVDERDSNWRHLDASPTVAQRQAIAKCETRHKLSCRIVTGCCD
jgi:hypothetical protein